MDDALFITAAGMGLVFVGILFLWGLMALLVKLTSHKKKTANEALASLAMENGDYDLDCKRKAAAAAVVAAITLLNTSFTSSKHKEREDISPWQAAHRSQQINRSNVHMRRKVSRK